MILGIKLNNMKDNAPIGYTCGIIDKVLNNILCAKDEAEYIIDNFNSDNPQQYISNIIDYLYEAIDDIEDVRRANSQLRDWGNELYAEKEELEEELKNTQKSIDEFNAR